MLCSNVKKKLEVCVEVSRCVRARARARARVRVAVCVCVCVCVSCSFGGAAHTSERSSAELGRRKYAVNNFPFWDCHCFVSPTPPV